MRTGRLSFAENVENQWKDLIVRGIGPGTIIGEILDMLFEQVLEDETKNQEEKLWQLVEQFVAKHSAGI